MASYLITGCSRGLGLELVKQLVSASSSSVGLVFATARSTTPSAALSDMINSSGGRVRFVQLDVTDDDSIEAATKEVAHQLGDKGLDVLINNAGIQSLEMGGASCMDSLEITLASNVVSVHKVSSAFLPLLSKGKEKKLVNISSTLGSMALKGYSALAPYPSYKISKAALNMLTVQYSLELGPKGFMVFAVSPGWLQTDLGGPQADLPPETGAKAVMDIVYNSSKEDNGAFRNIHIPGHPLYDGENPPW
ncbi:MAG: hypothetical protein M1818_000632 [Claussenomyces sp. TS43310]|nr:MAG: hypothetical protein M1818_000632 [Claussenomyces sp. TS43310]